MMIAHLGGQIIRPAIIDEINDWPLECDCRPHDAAAGSERKPRLSFVSAHKLEPNYWQITLTLYHLPGSISTSISSVGQLPCHELGCDLMVCISGILQNENLLRDRTRQDDRPTDSADFYRLLHR